MVETPWGGVHLSYSSSAHPQCAIPLTICMYLVCVHTKGSHHMLPPNRHLLLSTKKNGTQSRTLVSPRRMHCMYCGMPKGTSQAEVTSNSEKIKPVAFAIIELHLSEGISLIQSVSYPVSRKFHLII